MDLNLQLMHGEYYIFFSSSTKFHDPTLTKYLNKKERLRFLLRKKINKETDHENWQVDNNTCETHSAKEKKSTLSDVEVQYVLTLSFDVIIFIVWYQHMTRRRSLNSSRWNWVDRLDEK